MPETEMSMGRSKPNSEPVIRRESAPGITPTRWRSAVLGLERPPHHESEDQGSRLLVDDLWRQTHGRGLAARGRLVESHHTVERQVVADPDEEGAAGVVRAEVRMALSVVYQWLES